MNNEIIPLGPTEAITNGTISRKALVVTAETDLVITDLVFGYPASPANAGAVDAFTLLATRSLFNVKSMTFTGTATVIYNT